MSSVNRESLRTEFSAIQQCLEQMKAEGKINAECQVLINSLIVLLKILIAIFMEKKTIKGSGNSSIPPSQTPKDETTPEKKKRQRRQGKEESEKESGHLRIEESVQIITVNDCPQCGEDLSQIPAHHCDRRTLIDIVFVKTIQHVDSEIR